MWFRFWDVASKSELKKHELFAPVNDIELSRDGTTLIVAYGSRVAFFEADTLVFFLQAFFFVSSSIKCGFILITISLFCCCLLGKLVLYGSL